jgi:hypothetical protein
MTSCTVAIVFHRPGDWRAACVESVLDQARRGDRRRQPIRRRAGRLIRIGSADMAWTRSAGGCDALLATKGRQLAGQPAGGNVHPAGDAATADLAA